KHDRDVRGCRFCGTSGRRAAGHDGCRMAAKQIGRQSIQPVVLAVRKARLDYDIPSVNKAGLIEALTKCCCDEHLCLSRATVQESDHWRRRLLLARRDRPRSCRAAEQRDKLAASNESCHLIPPAEGLQLNDSTVVPAFR